MPKNSSLGGLVVAFAFGASTVGAAWAVVEASKPPIAKATPAQIELLNLLPPEERNHKGLKKIGKRFDQWIADRKKRLEEESKQ